MLHANPLTAAFIILWAAVMCWRGYATGKTASDGDYTFLFRLLFAFILLVIGLFMLVRWAVT